MVSSLTYRRASFQRLLTVPCTVWRDGRDSFGAHTGIKNTKVGDTMCGVVAGYAGGSPNSLANTLAKALTINRPGARTLSFRWDDNVQTADEVRVGSTNFRNGTYLVPNPAVGDAKYTLGQVNSDDPARVGLQVPGDVVRDE